jgi:peroxiredoxin
VKRKIPIIAAVITFILLALIGCSTAKIPQVGDKAPDFTLEGIDGKSLSLSDFHGKAIVVIFTHVNCSNCEDQMSYIKAVSQSASEGLVVLTVYFFSPTNVVREYVVKERLTDFPVLLDPVGKAAAKYGVEHVAPVNIFIDAEGIIREIRYGAFHSEKEIYDTLESL